MLSNSPKKRTRDHFVPVTYLKAFSAASQGGKLHVYRKRTGRHSLERPENVCCEVGGDLNKFFGDPTILREYLRLIEPQWNHALGHFVAGQCDLDAFFCAAGLMAYLLTYTPSARRRATFAWEQTVELSRPLIARHALRTESDKRKAHGIANVLLSPDRFRVRVDPEYPEALAITNLALVGQTLFKGRWILGDTGGYRHLITGDVPACYHFASSDSVIGTIYFPISPTQSLLVKPHLREQSGATALETKIKFGGAERYTLRPEGVDKFNALVAQSAEDCLVASSHEDWIEALLQQYKDWRLEALVDQIPAGAGYYQTTRLRPRPRAAARSELRARFKGPSFGTSEVPPAP